MSNPIRRTTSDGDLVVMPRTYHEGVEFKLSRNKCLYVRDGTSFALLVGEEIDVLRDFLNGKYDKAEDTDDE